MAKLIVRRVEIDRDGIGEVYMEKFPISLEFSRAFRFLPGGHVEMAVWADIKANGSRARWYGHQLARGHFEIEDDVGAAY